MTANEILALQQRRPFTGLRVHVSDGVSYDVLHPERMVVTRTLVHIALSPGPDGVPDRSIYCDPKHVTRVELLNGSKRPRSRKQTKS